MIFANHFETAPFLCLLDYERWLLATVWWIVATNLAFRRKVSPTEALDWTHY